MKTITIDPITRLEGHGKIDVFLGEDGQVANAYLIIPELRGFEKFAEGRPAEEMPRITAKICGVCPEAHHLAGTKALDAAFHVDPPPAAKKLRELFYCAHQVHSHIAHFYALAAPDFVVGPDGPPAERNILGVVARVGLDIGKEVIRHRAMAQEIQKFIGGRATYPVCGLPGGMSKPLTEEERQVAAAHAESLVEFAKFSLKLFADAVLANEKYLSVILSKDLYYTPTYSMGTVDAQNRVNFYDGLVRVVDTEGKEFAKFPAADYRKHIAEHVEPWSYLKFAYLRQLGWNGLSEEGAKTLPRVGPLARLNVADGMATPLAQAEYEKMFETLGGKPVHHTLAFHWARLVELLYAAERLVELANDPEITSKDVRTVPTSTPDDGVGIVEAPRGTLTHHYQTDPNGMITKANLVVATGLNYGAICASVTKIAKALVTDGKVTEGTLNMIEMAFRAYDPCFSCASHSLTGRMPLLARVYDAAGKLVDVYRRD
jgi:F420-non-reducing hydrogenase large subunit